MDSQASFTRVQVVYQLSRDGKLEHPHMIEVQYPSDQDGLCLKGDFPLPRWFSAEQIDVKKRLTTVRGKGMLDSFSWSYKKSYKSTFIWNDLSDGDVILPLCGSGEYILKASELIGTFATKAAPHHNEYPNERRHSSFTPSQVADGFCLDNSKQVLGPDGCYGLPNQSRNVSFDDYSKFTLEQSVNKDSLNSTALANNVRSDQSASAVSTNAGSMSADASIEDEEAEGVVRGIKEKPSTISLEQETIDFEKPDFCLSSSDGEISPRPDTVVKEVKEPLIVRTRSSTVQEFGTPSSFLASAASPLHSPGSTRRMWNREIRKSLFRTQNCNSSRVSGAQEEVTLDGGSAVSSTQQDVSFLSDSRSKSFCATGVGAPTGQTEKKVEQPTSHRHLIKMFFSRWTGGSKSKRSAVKTCDPDSNSSSQDAKNVEKDEAPASVLPLSISEAPWNERNCVTEGSLESTCPQIVERQACDLTENGADALKEVTVNLLEQQASCVIEESVTAKVEDMCSTTMSATLPKPTHSSLHPVLLQLSPLQVPSSPVLEETSQWECESPAQPPATESSPRPAIARVLVKTTEDSSSVSKEPMTPGKPFPPGFHKGTNDTKPRTPRKSIRSPISALSPPFMRSLSRNGVGSNSGRSTYTGSPNPVAICAWREGPVDKKCSNFQERDERPLIPGLTNLDWERTLQEAVRDCLPPPDFRYILEECSTCGRTFKPDSLKVHMRGCHSPRNMKTRPRAFITSPNTLRA